MIPPVTSQASATQPEIIIAAVGEARNGSASRNRPAGQQTVLSQQVAVITPQTSQSIHPVLPSVNPVRQYAVRVAENVQHFASSIWGQLQSLACGSARPTPPPRMTPAEQSCAPMLFPKPPPVQAFDALKKEISAADPKQLLRRADSLPQDQDSHNETHEEQIRTAKFISEFFMKSYSDIPQKLSFQSKQPYNPLLQSYKSQALGAAMEDGVIVSLPLREQLWDIQHFFGDLCRPEDRDTVAAIQAFCKKTARAQDLSLAVKRSVLGKVLYLASTDLAGTVQAVKKEDGTAIYEIQKLFDDQMDQIALHLKPNLNKLQAAPLQDSGKIAARNLTRELSKCLIPRAGTINAAIIPDLTAKFFPVKSQQDPWEVHAKYALESLMNSELLRDKLGAIHILSMPDSPACNLIKIALGLPFQAEISDKEAQQAALDALLSYPRQGKSGSCFASFLTIGLMASNLEICLDDFASLLKFNCLYRNTSDRLIQFPFRLSISQENITRSTASVHADNPLQGHAPEGGLYDSMNAAVAIESQSYNPLLRVWESVIAGMAEGADNGFIKPQIIDSIMFAIERKLMHSIPQNQELEVEISRLVKETLQRRIQLQFCPQIPHQGADDDGNSVQGAFVVYDTGNSSFPSQWRRIENPTKFQGFIQSIMSEAKENLNASRPALTPLYEPALDSITTYVMQDDFIIQTIKKCGYHQEKNPVANFDKIDNTPWMFKTGTNPKKVLQIYFEQEHPPLLQTQLCHDAGHLLAKIIEKAETQAHWISKCAKPQIRLPVSIQGLHVFSLLPNHPTLWPMVENPAGRKKYLEEKTMGPGREIASCIPSEESRKAMLARCEKKHVPPEKITEFRQGAANIKMDLTTKEFRDELLKILMTLNGKEASQARIALELDRMLVKNLPGPLQQKLVETAIHIADTNWAPDKGPCEIHLCVVVNPGTGLLELWKINNDNTKPTPMEQNYWLLGHPWEFYP